MTYRSERSLSHSSPVMFLFLFAPPHRPLQNSITYSTYYFLHSPSCFSLHYFGSCFLFTGRFAKTHSFPCIRLKVEGVCTCAPPTSTPSPRAPSTPTRGVSSPPRPINKVYSWPLLIFRFSSRYQRKQKDARGTNQILFYIKENIQLFPLTLIPFSLCFSRFPMKLNFNVK